MDQIEKTVLQENLKKLSIADLCNVAGNNLIEVLENEGMSVISSEIIELIIEDKGYSIFKNQIIRDHFSLLAEKEFIKTWGQNNACRALLQEFNLSENFLPDRAKKRDISFNSTPDFILHDYQDDIKKQTSNFLLSDKKKLMIQLPTGAGKTSMTIESIIDFFRLTQNCSPFVVWMAHTDELCEQAISAFDRAWKNKGTFEVNLIRLWGGNVKDFKKMDKPSFIVTSFQSAYSMIKTPRDDVFSNYNFISGKTSLLVVDEAHMSLAETYNAAINLFLNAKAKLIGLTATPGRHGVDGDNEETIKLANFYDKNIINMNHFSGDNLTPVQFLQSRGILSKVAEKRLITDFKLDLTSRELKKLQETGSLPDGALKKTGEDAKRNGLIFNQIQLVVKKYKKKTLVFASSVENSNLLASLLRRVGVKARSVTGESQTSDRMNAVKDFKEGNLEVLVNFNIFSTGFDDPMIDCVVVARPTFSVVLYSQMIGRGLRGEKNGGTKECLLVNVVDNIINLPDIEHACNFFDKDWIKMEDLNG